MNNEQGNKGVRLSNVALDMLVPLPTTLFVKMWQLKTLRTLLAGHFYAAIQIMSETAIADAEIVVLRTRVDDSFCRPIYPSLH